MLVKAVSPFPTLLLEAFVLCTAVIRQCVVKELETSFNVLKIVGKRRKFCLKSFSPLPTLLFLGSYNS